MKEAAVMGGAAVAAYLLTARKPAALTAPPEGTRAAIRSSISTLGRSFCGVVVRDDDGPVVRLDNPAAGFVAHQVAQRHALARAKGAYASTLRGGPVPKLDAACLLSVTDRWLLAYGAWIGLGREIFDGDYVIPANNAARALREHAERVRVAATWSGASVATLEPYAVEAWRRIETLAAELSNIGELGERPADPYPEGVGGFLSAYSDNLSKYVTGPIVDTAGNVLGAAAGGLAQGAANLVLSPIGAAAILAFAAWKAFR